MTIAEPELSTIVAAAHETALALVCAEVSRKAGRLDDEASLAEAEGALRQFFAAGHENLRSGLLQVALIRLAAWAVLRPRATG
jgi:hypothetical protein